MPGRFDMCFPVWRVRLSYRLAQVWPTLSPRSSTRWGTARAWSCCEVARPAGPAPTTSTRAGSGIHRLAHLGADALRHPIGGRHDREIGIDLQRIGEEARGGHPQPRQPVYEAPGVGDGIRRATALPAAANQASSRGVAAARGAGDDVAPRVTHIVGDVARVPAYENERGVTGETVAALRQASREGGPEQQGGRPDRASRAHHGPRPDPILPRRPLGWAALRPRRSRSDPDEKRAVAADPDDLRPRHDLHSLALGARQLHPVRALLRLVRATEVAQARPAAALHIDGELLDSESGLPSPLDEQPVVIVDEGVFEQVDAVLRGEPLRAGHDVGVIEAGDAPAPDHTLGRGERGAGVDDGGAAVRGGERQG